MGILPTYWTSLIWWTAFSVEAPLRPLVRDGLYFEYATTIITLLQSCIMLPALGILYLNFDILQTEP